MISFTVPGKPIPQGGMKAFARGNKAFVTHKNPKDLGDYRARITLAAEAAGAERIESDAVYLFLTFHFDRPRGHYGTGKNAQRLKDSAPPYVVTRPDIDKLVRSVLDALTGVAFRDDSQVVDVNATKYYCNGGVADTPRTTIWVMTPDELEAGIA